jgi:hypothetical protein
MFFLRMRDEQVEEIDLATALYPFIMVSASGETSDM